MSWHPKESRLRRDDEESRALVGKGGCLRFLAEFILRHRRARNDVIGTPWPPPYLEASAATTAMDSRAAANLRVRYRVSGSDSLRTASLPLTFTTSVIFTALLSVAWT